MNGYNPNLPPLPEPKFAPPAKATRPSISELIEQLKASKDPEVQARLAELNKHIRPARHSADLTRTKRGSEVWTAEFIRVLEGGRPMREARPKPLTHRPVITYATK